MSNYSNTIDGYSRTADSDWYKQRLNWVMLCVMAAFAVLMVRLFHLQVIGGEEFRRLSENNCIRLQSLEPPRGKILDRYGKLMVDNRPSFDLSIILKDAKPVNQTIEKLANYMGVSAETLMKTISRKKSIYSYRPILLKQDIGRDMLAAIEVHKFELPGIIVDVKPRRNYITKQSEHLIGYLSEINSEELRSGKYPGSKAGDYIGKFGIEKAYEQFLRGHQGGRQVEVNATGQVVKILETVEAKPGHNIFLTINQELQLKARALLAGKAGAVVAMEPTTGGILAMVSSPSFDQNAFVNGMSHKQWEALISNPLRPMENKVIQGEYPPASTYKIVTAIAGIEEGIIDDEFTISCPGYYKYGDRVFRCWKKGGHGSVDIIKAIAESCDVFFYQVGNKLGIDRLAWYAKACGLGSPTGINLDHESSGLVPTAAWKKRRYGIQWQGGETLSVAIGQGYDLVTPMQMLVLIAAVANGGTLYKPLFLKSIKTAGNELVQKGKTRISGKLPVSDKTLAIIRKGLFETVNNRSGTAWIVHEENINISGKTGTAQVIGRKENQSEPQEEIAEELKPHAWFVAYAPSDNPEIAVAVIVEHGEHGSSTAGPIANEVIKTYLMN